MVLALELALLMLQSGLPASRHNYSVFRYRRSYKLERSLHAQRTDESPKKAAHEFACRI